MTIFRVAVIAGLAGLASCTGDAPIDPSPAQAAATQAANPGEVDTTNSLPPSITNPQSINSGAGVVGVTHLPP